MRKYYSIITFIIIGLKLTGNPIATPTIEISELFFDNEDNWKLELFYYAVNQEDYPFDAIFLYSSTDSVKLPNYQFEGDNGVFVITKDSLDTEFNINRFGDSIRVVSYIWEGYEEDILIYGNMEGALINYPGDGQSICRYKYFFVKDKSPSIGTLNDTVGICGTLTGVVYDKYSIPVQNRTFIMDNSFKTSGNGEYLARVFSKPSNFHRIQYQIRPGFLKTVGIDTISYIMEPDSVIVQDIYLLDTLETVINEPFILAEPIKVYPNPVLASEKIFLEIDLPVKTANISISLVKLNGEVVKTVQIKEAVSLIETPKENGIYILNVWLENQIISSKRIVVK